MASLTPNMSLNVPTIGVDSGLVWEQSINANSSVLDGHNHSSGSGVQINPSGLNINADLPFGDNNATALRSVNFTTQASPLSLPADIGCIYVSGVDLYYNDENGNQVQITSGGSVNATSSGISSGTASASFSGAVLVVNAASSTPANIQCASILVGNTGVSGSKYCTLSPPSALAANYALTLPVVSPSGTQLMSIDASGNMAPNDGTVSSTVANNIGSNMTSTGANAILNASTKATGSSTEGLGGVAVSTSSGAFTTSSIVPATVTNVNITLTTSGKPVLLFCQPDGTANPSFFNVSNFSAAPGFQVYLYRGVTLIATFTGQIDIGGGTIYFPPSTVYFTDIVAAGTYTYSVKFGLATSGGTAGFSYMNLVGYETR